MASSRDAWEKQTRTELRAEVGAVDTDDLCGNGQCTRTAVYRVPWPHFGGDVAYCPYHLCRFRDHYPEVWRELKQVATVDDPDQYATLGRRFLTLDEVPKTIPVNEERMRRVALGVDGYALFDSVEPTDAGEVTFAKVDRALDVRERIVFHRTIADEFLQWFHDHEGWHRLDPTARTAFTEGVDR